MNLDDTIVALSSPAAPAARIILRISGPRTTALLASLSIEPRNPPADWRSTINFSQSPISVDAWIYWFAGPRSFTGQDLAELHIPGNPLLARLLMNHLIHHGARSAEAGEFTARAFFNGKTDLAGAEGIAAAIGAQNQRQLDAARRLMAGELSRRIRPVMDQLAETISLVEVGIDFSEEDVRFLPADEIISRLQTMSADLRALHSQSPRISRLGREPVFVLAGRPNAGKSTLLNTLAGMDRAIVSPLAGTTRDALSAEIVLRRGIVRLIDVAGLENAPDETDDATIPCQMRRQARRAIEEADHLLHLRDATAPTSTIEFSRQPSLTILTKIDLLQSIPVLPDENQIAISASCGDGLAELRERLDALAFGHDDAGESLALTARHLAALEETLAALGRAISVADDEAILAAELREALDALGQILGTVTPDEILGKIFSTFCIGK